MSLPYLSARFSGMTVIVLAAVGIFAVLLVWRLIKNGRARIPALVLGAYIFVVGALTLSGNPGGDIPIADRIGSFSLAPLIFTIRFNVPYLYLQYIVNVLLFVPLGILIPAVNARLGTYGRILLLGFGMSVTIEMLQLLLPGSNRIFDPIDIVCNTIGVLLGYSLFVLWLVRRTGGTLGARIGALIVCITIGLTFFVRPFLVFPDDLPMADSGYGLPHKIDAARGAHVDGASSLPVVDIEPKHDAGRSLQHGLWDPAAVRTDDDSASARDDHPICSFDDALKRARAGAIVEAYLPVAFYWQQPETVEVTSAQTLYAENKAENRLVPVWYLEVDIISCSGQMPPGWADQLTAEDRDEDMGQAFLVVPAL